MADGDGRRRVPGRTPFESMTHEELRALLSPARHDTPMELAARLASAAETVDDIGNALKRWVPLVRWEGEAGDAFRERGNRTANATLGLGGYVRNASAWLSEVSQAIVEAAHHMPPAAETEDARHALRLAAGNGSGPLSPGSAEKASDATAARARIDAARAEAARQMRKLADVYAQAGSEIAGAEPPAFPPAAGLPGREWSTPQRHRPLPTGRTEPLRADSGAPGGPPPATGRATLADATGPEPAAADESPGGQASAGHVAARGMPRGPDPASVVFTLDALVDGPHPQGVTQPLQAGHLPAAVRPEGAGPPVAETVPPPFVAGVATAVGRRAPEAPAPRVRRPAQGGNTPAAGRRSDVEADGIPRGSVTGAEGPAGRTPAGHATGTGGVAATAGGEGTGGRGPSPVTGVVVGGHAQPGATGSRPFTSGGAGLVRGPVRHAVLPSGAALSAAPASSPRGAGQRREDRGGDRPGHASDGGEARRPGGPRIVPPMVD